MVMRGRGYSGVCMMHMSAVWTVLSFQKSFLSSTEHMKLIIFCFCVVSFYHSDRESQTEVTFDLAEEMHHPLFLLCG